jgi:hypothetical protein
MRRRVLKLLAALFLIIAGIGVTAAVADATGLVTIGTDSGDAAGWE